MPGAARVIVVALAACAAAPPRAAPPVAPPAAHRYPVPAAVGQLVVDDAAFAAFARAVRLDLEGELAHGVSEAAAVRKRRFVLAVLDALDERWPDAVAELDRIRAIEPDARAQVMTGLTIRIWADARDHGGDTGEAFRGALERALAALPIDLVKDSLSELRTMGQVFTPELCRQLVDQEVGPHVAHGTIALDDAHAVIFQRYAVKRLVPVGAVIDSVLAAHGIAAKTE